MDNLSSESKELLKEITNILGINFPAKIENFKDVEMAMIFGAIIMFNNIKKTIKNLQKHN